MGIPASLYGATSFLQNNVSAANGCLTAKRLSLQKNIGY